MFGDVSCSVVAGTSYVHVFFFLMIRRPPRSTLDRSSAASDVYKRQPFFIAAGVSAGEDLVAADVDHGNVRRLAGESDIPVSYTHLRAHETVLDLVCRLLLEKTITHTYSALLS